MLGAAAVTVIDVLMRWLAGTAIFALNEIVAMAFGVAIAACIPAGVAGGVNLKIDIFCALDHRPSRRLAGSLRRGAAAAVFRRC